MKAVIFDMDGLMIDSEPLHRKAFNEVLKQYGAHVTEEEWVNVVGGTELSAVNSFIEKYGLSETTEELVKQKRIAYKNLISTLQAKPGLFDLLNKLALPISVASNGMKESVERVLKHLGLENRFDAVVYYSHEFNPKPAPDIYLAAADKLGIHPMNCLALEDTPTGLKAAKAAGMKCYVVPSPEANGQDFSSADRVLESLNDVIPAMKKDGFLDA